MDKEFILEELVAEIIQKAIDDEEFKKRLLNDPNGTFKDTTGIDLGEYNLVPHENTRTTAHIIISKKSYMNKSLSDTKDPKSIINCMAIDDKEFKDRLKEKPKETIEKLFEGKLSDTLNLIIIDETVENSKNINIVIPYEEQALIGHY